MKIAFDGSVFWETGMTYQKQYDTVARAGYEYINLYNADFPGFWKRPKATNEPDDHTSAMPPPAASTRPVAGSTRLSTKSMTPSCGKPGSLANCMNAGIFISKDVARPWDGTASTGTGASSPNPSPP